VRSGKAVGVPNHYRPYSTHEALDKIRRQANDSNAREEAERRKGDGAKLMPFNPLPHDPQQLHQALRSLNGCLKKIRFHAQEGGKAITWDLV
jgi:hypothetical protein